MGKLISPYEITITDFALAQSGWFTSRDAITATKFAGRTVRRHLARLAEVGLLERRTAYGGARFRKVRYPDASAVAYSKELDLIRELFASPSGGGKIFAALAATAIAWRHGGLF